MSFLLRCLNSCFQDLAEFEWIEWVAFTFEELVLELDPMQTQGVQEALQEVHAHEDAKGNCPQYRPKYYSFYNRNYEVLRSENLRPKWQLEESISQLRVRQRQGP